MIKKPAMSSSHVERTLFMAFSAPLFCPAECCALVLQTSPIFGRKPIQPGCKHRNGKQTSFGA